MGQRKNLPERTAQPKFAGLGARESHHQTRSREQEGGQLFDRSKEACGSMQLLGDFREYRYGDIQPYREYRIYLSTCTHIFSLK